MAQSCGRTSVASAETSTLAPIASQTARHATITLGSFVRIRASIGTSFSVSVYLSRIGHSAWKQIRVLTCCISAVDDVCAP